MSQTSVSERFLGIALAVVVLFFAHKAWPAINYFQNPFFIQALERQGGFWSLVSLIYQGTDNALLFLTIALPTLELLPDSDQEGQSGSNGEGTLLALLIFWAFLGWYAGTDFDPDDSPKMSFLAFSFISIFLGVMIGIRLVVSLLALRKNKQDTAE